MSARGHISRALFATVALLATPVATAHADAFDDVEIAADAELADARGGYITAGGVAFDLGAVITTWRNGALALQTVLNWTPQGPVATHVTGAPNATDLSLAQPVLTAGGGVALVDPSGRTMILHMGGDGAIMNGIVTAESNQTFVQDIAVTITLPGFDAMQAGFQNDLMGIRLGADLGALLEAGLR
jgi:hypothetical protein